MLCPPGQDERKMIMPAYYDDKQKTWYCKFYYKDWTGQRKQKLKRGFKLQRDAKDWERTFLEKQQGSPDMTFQVLYNLYTEDSRQRCKYSSYKTKKSLCEAHILPYFKDKPINQITPADIRKWQNEIKRSISSPVHQGNINRQFSSVLRFAVKYYGLGYNPFDIAGSIGKGRGRSMKFWTLDEFNCFIEHVEDPTLNIAFMVLFYAGIRLGELLALTMGDFDSSKGTLTISKTYHRYDKSDFITTPKTDHSCREVVLPAFMVEQLANYIKCNYGMQAEDRLFFSVTEFRLRYCKKAACNASGVKLIRLHDIRHSHVSLLIDMGFSPHLIAERIGDTVQMVNEIYGHLYPNKHNEVATKLHELVSK